MITLISILYILYKLIQLPFLFINAFITGYNKGKKRMSEARAENKRMVDTVVNGLNKTGGKLYYQTLDYSNKGSLKQFVNLILPVGDDLEIVNKEVNFYLITNGAKYPLVKYFGKKDELKNTIIIADMGQMYIENTLSNIYGSPVKLAQVI